jgi:hypothetical protein
MAQQRMAGDNEFQSKMKQAEKGPGGQEHKTKPATLFGADAYDRQVQRESQSFNNAAISGSRNADNIQAYANASKQATANNGDFSINAGNKWANAGREQKNTNKQDQKGFSDNRINNNVNYANAQQDRNLAKNEGFAMRTTNNFVNNAKAHREDNTAKATQFANNTVQKYMAMNKGNQVTNVAKLDQGIRQSPLYDEAKSKVQGLNTYGDMYRYGREEMPNFSRPDDPEEIKTPDFRGIYNDTRDDISNIKIKK